MKILDSLATPASSAASNSVSEFLAATSWGDAVCEPLAGDASVRHYFRVRRSKESVILMDASHQLDSVAPFVFIDRHLAQLGFSVPAIYASDEKKGFLLLEDFGDETFTRLLAANHNPECLYTLAVDVLVALHKHAGAIPQGLRAYHPQKMLQDIELFLDWCTPGLPEKAKLEFTAAWGQVLPLAHQAPVSLLLRDFHVANLMLLRQRQGLRQVGLLDFQDAYQGPVTYDLVSLLEDARRDVPLGLREKMLAHYLVAFPGLDPKAFLISLAILAALRHTRVLAIFERLSRHEGKHDYKRLHSPRVERMLKKALAHPALNPVREWMEKYAS